MVCRFERVVTLRQRRWLMELRVSRGLTHEQVARLARIERSTYTKAENGAPLRVKTAKRIASVLGFDWVRFFDEECDQSAQLDRISR
ncbi:MAG: helix-turn-helix transcriptional regulator [Kyrpidia sp.]|nr:helix-turn-helix transcriptional regulator [Kyrpidia sp.]